MRSQPEIAKAQQSRKIFRTFLRDEKGVTAIEFALVAFPFLGFIFMIVELGLSFAAQQMLSYATEDISRQFYTGQLTTRNTTPELVRNKICSKMKVVPLTDCSRLYINLDNYASFADVPVKNLVTKDGYLGLPQRINIGGQSTINQINVLYRWPVFTNILYFTNPAVKPADRIMPLFATGTWQNEPYS